MGDFLKSLDRTKLYWTAAGLIGVFYTLGCLHEVANYWQWGHNGYIGSSYMQAAVNSLRFEIFGQVKFHTGLEAPGAEDIYTHHPMLIHLHLVPLVWLAGPIEWLGRLVPAIYSILNLGMLFILVRRHYGDAVALIAAASFAFLPINLVYANMIGHEQGGMFWCLVTLYTYTRWAETYERRYFIGTMIAITLAVQFEWFGYYIALFTVLHAFYQGFHRAEEFEWRPEFTFVVVFSIVVLANAAAWFGYIYVVREGFGDMSQSFSARTSSPKGYWTVLWTQLKSLYGVLPISILIVWLFVATIRLARWDVHYGDLIPIFFLLGQAIRSSVFQQAGKVHYFWIYFLGPAVAVATGHLLWSAVKAARTLLERWEDSEAAARDRIPWPPDAATIVLILGLVAAPLAVQAQYGYRQMERGAAVAGAMSYDTYDDQFDDIMWVQKLTQIYDRSDTDFLIHFDNKYRIEWYFYLDAPHRRWRRLSFPESLEEKERNQVLLVDLRQVEDRAQLNRLVHRYRTTMFDRTFLAIEATEPGGSFEAYDRTEGDPSFLWKWFVNGRRPPVEWVPDERFADPSRMFPKTPDLKPNFAVGGSGGEPTKWNCPADMTLQGLNIGLREPSSPKVEWFEPICVPDGPSSEDADRYVGPVFGLKPAGETGHQSLCPPETSAVGLHGRAGRFVDALGITCQTSDDAETKQEIIGGPGGDPFSKRCPKGTVAWGIRARTGNWVDGAGLVCRELEGSAGR